MKKNYILFVSLIVFLSIFMWKTTVLAVYNDITGHWAEETIIDFVEKEYLVEVEENFKPNEMITKGELATVVNRFFAYGKADSEEENLKIAMENGFLSNATVKEHITREEVAILICKVLSLEVSEKELSFQDKEKISIWAKGYVAAVEENGIMIGYPNLQFCPQKNITKAEMVTVLNRCIGIGGMDVELVKKDITNIEVGILQYDSGIIRVLPMEDVITMQVGESVVLAIKTPEEIKEEEIEFEISDSQLIAFDRESYEVSAMQTGEVEIIIKTQSEKYQTKFSIRIK